MGSASARRRRHRRACPDGIVMELKLAIVEDLAQDAELMALRLEDEGFNVEWQRVQTEAEYLACLQQAQPDLILCDWHLPRFSGQRALELLRELRLDIPVILVSGGIGEEAAIAAMRQGATDYVLKDRPARLGEAVRQALEQQRLQREHARAHERLRLAERAFENTAEGIAITDADAAILSVNPAFEEITGYSADEIIGRNPRLLRSGRHSKSFYRDMWATLLGVGHWRGEIWNRRKNGEIYPQWCTISTVRDSAGVITHFVGVFSDVSNTKAAQAQIDFLAHHDALTGLPNRSLFRERLSHALSREHRAQGSLALLFIDLDRFKTVNDTLGHPAGDELLVQVGRRFSGVLRSCDTLARIGGDELVLLLEDGAGPREAATVARKLLRVSREPITVSGHTLFVTASIGVSLYPSDGADADTLIQHADRAMYEAKQQGRNNFQFFRPALTEGALERLVMESALRTAVERRELALHFQPQLDLATGRLAGVEALVRWQHPELGRIPPGRFIPLAEEIGVIGEIGDWVLTSACQQLAAWDAAGIAIPRVSVNLSVKEIDHQGTVDRLIQAVRAHGLTANRLEVEVTESVLMRDPERSCSMLNALKSFGVGLAVDDFGTGYSSLAYLKRLPLDRLKIDRSFVDDIGRDKNDEAIARAVIALAKTLGLNTVAEGVEEEHQARFLNDEGCDLAQGYLYSRPVPATELAAWYHGRAAAPLAPGD